MSYADPVQLAVPEWLDTLAEEPQEEALAQLEHLVAEWSHALGQVLDQAAAEAATSHSKNTPSPPVPALLIPDSVSPGTALRMGHPPEKR